MNKKQTLPLKTKLISIITVCYNACHLIEKTIQSVLEQTFQDFEYIVIDGKSTDRTHEIINTYRDNIDIYISEKDTGIYNAMNKGAALATGKWILFLNAGDILADLNSLANIAPYLNGDDADVVYGDIYKERKPGELFIKKSTPPGNKHKMYFCHQAVFCRTEIVKAHPFDENYRLSADFKFFKEIYLKGYRFKQTDIPLTVFDTKGASNVNRLMGLNENIKVINEIDNIWNRIILLPRLLFVCTILRIRNKKRKADNSLKESPALTDL